MNNFCRRCWTPPGLAILALIATGCEPAAEPQFRVNMVQMVSNETDPAYQQEIADVLGAMFGTPDQPQTLADAGLDPNLLSLAGGAAWSAADGVGHGLYRKHCVHCHGITGDGRGPTARFLNPYPRDYRKGVFKFKSTYNPAKPTDEDLERVLINGVPGTSMPSFSLLPEADVAALIEYVKYLAIRGEMEQKLIQYVFDELGEVEAVDDKGEPVVDEDGQPVMQRIPLDPAANAEQADVVKEILAEVLAPWQEAADQVIVPIEEEIPSDERSAAELAESVAKGRELFFGARANCVKCHGPTALGDGQQTDFDEWAKEQKTFMDATAQLADSLERRASADAPPDESDEAAAARELKDERDADTLAARRTVEGSLYPLRNAIPRNLRKGVYRGGQRRLDVFWRVHAGIAGSPMPAAGATAPGGQGTLTEAEIWQIVDYVLSLPYEALSLPQRSLPANEGAVTQ